MAGASKNIKAVGSTLWGYFKVEAAPPLTVGILHGKVGKVIEETTGRFVDKIITNLDKQVKSIKREEELRIKRREAAIKAALEAKLEAERKKQYEKMAAILKLAAEAREVTAAKAKEEEEKAKKEEAEKKAAKSDPTNQKGQEKGKKK